MVIRRDRSRRFFAGKGNLCTTLLALLLAGCAAKRPEPPVEPTEPKTGREIVLEALVPPTPRLRSGILATAISSANITPANLFRGTEALLKRLTGDHGGEPLEIQLFDGTRVGGILFPYLDGTDRPKPLLIASFGFLQDRWGTESAKFHDMYIRDSETRLPAHILILDHPSGGPFLANNGNLSVGSYDDARMWIDVARLARLEMNLSSIHLLGVSMSGQTVVHALIEDERLGLDLFDSGLAISIAPDFREAPGEQLAQVETGPAADNPWAAVLGGPVPSPSFADRVQREALWALIETRFVPGYRRIPGADPHFTVERTHVPELFWQSFSDRVRFLREQSFPPRVWNGAFDLGSLVGFMASTRIAGVIQTVPTPLVLVSARDDPAVDRSLFMEVAEAAKNNPWVISYETEHGGHFGFNVAYGSGYLGGVVRLLLDEQLLENWNGVRTGEKLLSWR